MIKIQSDDINETETTVEETVVEESPLENQEDTIAEQPAVTFEEDKPLDDSKFAEVDNLDNTLTESNLDYLTTKETSDDSESNNINSDLKQEIKSVLLYMDQLLENLPDEKIAEFAKSDEFTTYKKLFSELGLS